MVKRRLCVITGATSGIGWEVAHQMAKKGFDLKIIGRSEQKGELLLKSIRKLVPDCEADYYLADLSKLAEVKSVAAEIGKSCVKIDALINNAGGVFSKFETTEEGIEKTMASNHLGCFVLTHGLLPLLKKSKEARIIVVSSGSHFLAKMSFDSFTSKKGYYIRKAYQQSKLANVMFTYKLTRLLEGTSISTFVLHPGVVKTPIGAKSQSWVHRFAWKIIGYFKYNTTVEESAKTYVYLASEKETSAHNGFYFHRGLIEKSAKLSYDVDLQERLWSWSEEVTGVKYV